MGQIHFTNINQVEYEDNIYIFINICYRMMEMKQSIFNKKKFQSLDKHYSHKNIHQITIKIAANGYGDE